MPLWSSLTAAWFTGPQIMEPKMSHQTQTLIPIAPTKLLKAWLTWPPKSSASSRKWARLLLETIHRLLLCEQFNEQVKDNWNAECIIKQIVRWRGTTLLQMHAHLDYFINLNEISTINHFIFLKTKTCKIDLSYKFLSLVYPFILKIVYESLQISI